MNMQVSYAQRLEDYHLAQVFFDVPRGVYVDVGGGHPVADNVSYHFYLEGWRGIIVEPQGKLASLYAALRPRDIVFDCLVGAVEKDVAFHAVDRLHGFSTTLEEHALGAARFGAGYRTEVRKCRPLAALLEETGLRDIEFLKIDVEGAEADVLMGADLARHRPKVLCIESVAPGLMEDASGAWEPFLRQRGYAFAFFDGLNRFYVAQEHATIAARFPREPADWGVVKHLYEFGRAHADQHHPDRALALRLIKGFLAGVPNLSEAAVLDLLTRSAPGGVLESGEELRALLHGKLGSGEGELFDDQTRAALGRMAAQYDGGMISDDADES
jgi:FkbM family methyltransferase